ncbi:hypothetical protein FHR81_001128 [Actinoalloteichus hoggarensis]|uniref:Uncharacterized protein n=1 Tax=Actinoalloteichus hoggarensis TaxID=1470176 RepID=A0A221VZA7_9PSEU|nr:hypothetical protein [Actinoalloteichus hoggarensis]ASO18863.1 hypothetical protein AHOG_06055 [Actinoalloteichus hoggarensis]MBB5920098.1 hypothetical protein [Actinoalloteichus hoggarensis]
MSGLAWYVRTVRSGDSHLAAAEWNGSDPIRPVCAPTVEFRAMNRRPLRMCFYDEQRCPLCLRHAGTPPTARDLIAAAPS